jgi:hypothetical protein
VSRTFTTAKLDGICSNVEILARLLPYTSNNDLIVMDGNVTIKLYT